MFYFKRLFCYGFKKSIQRDEYLKVDRVFKSMVVDGEDMKVLRGGLDF